MTSQFSRPEITDEMIEEFGHKGNGSVKYQVNGFWSSDVISVSVDKPWCDENWKVSIRRSSGGRDTDVIVDDIEAESNYSYALIDAIEVAKYMKEQIPVLNKHYNIRMEEYNKEREEKEKEKQAKIDADIGFTEQQAKSVVKDMVNSIKESNDTFNRYHVSYRGKDDVITISVKYFNKVCIYVGNKIYSRKNMVEFLQNMSQKSFKCVYSSNMN